MNLSLAGKTAVVSGAARGIGLAICVQLAEQGARMVLVDQDSAVLAAAASLGGGAVGVVCDVADGARVAALGAALARDHGGIDILVNNAGISPKKDGRKFHLEETPEADWDRVMAVNLRSMFLLSKATVGAMKARGGGRIVNISSQAGRGRADLTSAHYAASKAGVIGLTRALAGELGRYAITVNAIAPGFIESDMSGSFSARRRQAVIDATPLKRAGLPQDIASATGFLASAAAGFMTGAVLDVNGGGFM